MNWLLYCAWRKRSRHSSGWGVHGLLFRGLCGSLLTLTLARVWAEDAGAGAAAVSATAVAPEAAEWKRLSLEDLMNLQVKDVTTASKRREKSTEAPATVLVIDRRDIQLRGYRFLSDVLRDLPGMETAPMYFSEIGTLAALGNASVLIVGETEGFARRGGVINFVAEGGRLRFEINLAEARRRGLKLNSQLLSLAKIVGTPVAQANE